MDSGVKSAWVAGGLAVAGLIAYARRKYLSYCEEDLQAYESRTEEKIVDFIAARKDKPVIDCFPGMPPLPTKQPSSSSSSSSAPKTGKSSSSGSSSKTSSSSSATSAPAPEVSPEYDLFTLPIQDALALIDTSLENLRSSRSTPVEASIEAQISALKSDTTESMDGRLRVKLATWLDTFTTRSFASAVAEGARPPALVKAQAAVWSLLDLTPAQVKQLDPDRARALLVERMTVAYQLQLVPELTAAYDVLYSPERREELSLVDMIVLFPHAGLLGRWDDVRELGALLTPTLDDFFDTAMAMPTLPDMRLLYRLATHYDTRLEQPFDPAVGLTPEKDEENLRPHPLMAGKGLSADELSFDEWDIRVLIMDINAAKSHIPDEATRAELGVDVKRPPRKFAPGKLRIHRRGGVMMMPALLPTKAMVVGPWAGENRMVFNSYITLSPTRMQHESYELKRLTPENAAGYSQWGGSYRLFEVEDGVVGNVFWFDIGMKLHRARPSGARGVQVATQDILSLAVAAPLATPTATPPTFTAAPAPAAAPEAATAAGADAKGESKASEPVMIEIDVPAAADAAADAAAAPEADSVKAEGKAEAEAETEESVPEATIEAETETAAETAAEAEAEAVADEAEAEAKPETEAAAAAEEEEDAAAAAAAAAAALSEDAETETTTIGAVEANADSDNEV